jgi:hypothetical protein
MKYRRRAICVLLLKPVAKKNMGQRIGKTCFVLWMMAAACSILTSSALAGIAVSPMQQWVTAKPGQDAFFNITVTNTLRGPQTISQAASVEIIDFEVSPDGGISFGKEFAHPRSAAKFITLADGDDKFVLEPGQSKQIKAKVSVPMNCDGDYWAAAMVKLLNPQKDAKGVVINLQTASGVFIHVQRRSYTARGSITDANIILPDFAARSDPNRRGGIFENSALQITSELKNDGVTAFLGDGKAYLYSGKMKRFASIPLHAARRQIFPGQSRIFTGVLSDALPEGTYKMRVIFEPTPQHNDGDMLGIGRKIVRDFDFTVDSRLAQKWPQKSNSAQVQRLKYDPDGLKLSVTAGRFTAVSLLIENIGVSTVAVKTHFGQSAVKDWFSSESDRTTFGPNMKRNIVFSLNVPRDAQPGDYTGVLMLEAQRSTVGPEDVTQKMSIPINITIT